MLATRLLDERRGRSSGSPRDSLSCPAPFCAAKVSGRAALATCSRPSHGIAQTCKSNSAKCSDEAARGTGNPGAGMVLSIVVNIEWSVGGWGVAGDGFEDFGVGPVTGIGGVDSGRCVAEYDRAGANSGCSRISSILDRGTSWDGGAGESGAGAVAGAARRGNLADSFGFGRRHVTALQRLQGGGNVSGVACVVSGTDRIWA